MSVKRDILRNERGAAAVEFSLLATIFLTLLFGVFQLGLALHYGASVRWALETSARTLLINPATTEAQLRTKMLSYLAGVPGADSVSVTLTTDTTAKMYKADAAYAYPLSVPFLPTYNLSFKSTVTVPALS